MEPKYWGVRYRRLSLKYEARIGYKRTPIGLYDTAEQAARAYDRAVVAKHGAATMDINFPLSDYIDLQQPAPHIRNPFSVASTLRLYPALRDAYVPDETQDGQCSHETLLNYSIAVYDFAYGDATRGLIMI